MLVRNVQRPIAVEFRRQAKEVGMEQGPFIGVLLARPKQPIGYRPPEPKSAPIVETVNVPDEDEWAAQRQENARFRRGLPERQVDQPKPERPKPPWFTKLKKRVMEKGFETAEAYLDHLYDLEDRAQPPDMEVPDKPFE